MRKSTMLWLILAFLCGSTLFYISEKTRDSREDLAVVLKKLSSEREAIRVLEAEWSYLNQPQRLEKLARKHLQTSPARIAQFVDSSYVSSNSYLASVDQRRVKIKTSLAKRLDDKKITANKKVKSAPETASNDRSFSSMIRSWGNE